MHLDPDVRRNCAIIPAPEWVVVGNADISGQKTIVRVTQHDAVIATRLVAPADLVRLSEPRTLATGPRCLIVEYFFRGDDARAGRISATGYENDAALSHDIASVTDQLRHSEVGAEDRQQCAVRGGRNGNRGCLSHDGRLAPPSGH